MPAKNNSLVIDFANSLSGTSNNSQDDMDVVAMILEAAALSTIQQRISLWLTVIICFGSMPLYLYVGGIIFNKKQWKQRTLLLSIVLVDTLMLGSTWISLLIQNFVPH